MIRTISEDPCQDCGTVTNAYDPLMGRLCPKCCAKRCAEFGKSLEFHQQGKLYMGDFNPEKDMEYLAESNQYLLTAPLIDHSDDIDREFSYN